jgi:hypothetical protein
MGEVIASYSKQRRRNERLACYFIEDFWLFLNL